MQSRPIAPTGAAMAKPIARPRAKYVTSIPGFPFWSAPGSPRRSGAQKTHQPVKVWWVAVRRSDAERVPNQTSRSAGPTPEQSSVALNCELERVARDPPHHCSPEHIDLLSNGQARKELWVRVEVLRCGSRRPRRPSDRFSDAPKPIAASGLGGEHAHESAPIHRMQKSDAHAAQPPLRLTGKVLDFLTSIVT
jgi:hypothetical protein